MAWKLSSWLELFGALGQALSRLLQAEAAALSGDLKQAGRGLAKALALFAVAAFVAFWALGALAYALVEVLTIWLPRWAAASSVLGFLVLVAVILGLIGRGVLGRLEKPAETVRRHLDDHRGWWRQHVAQLGSAEFPGSDGSRGAAERAEEETGA